MTFYFFKLGVCNSLRTNYDRAIIYCIAGCGIECLLRKHNFSFKLHLVTF